MKKLTAKISMALAAILFLLGLLITILISYQIRELTRIKKVVSPGFIEVQVGEFGTYLQDISSFIKIPLSLLYFDIYAENYLSSASTTENLYLNIDINGEYSHAIKFGEKKRIYKSIRGAEIRYLFLTRSITTESGTTSTPKIGSFYSYFISPTLLSFMFIYLTVGVPIGYALIVLINSYRRFILFGTPFLEKRDIKRITRSLTNRKTKGGPFQTNERNKSRSISTIKEASVKKP